ncbi:MAG: zinc-ribbon domain-containing protein [Mariprofundaceae bacterium]|nr:zinc-ribbon domain-containing protein [Mariprofundaceae bacterium]
MKFIECIHCQKRYPSNRKLEEAALRRKVRCTDCGESFPIVVYEVKTEENLPVGPEPFFLA